MRILVVNDDSIHSTGIALLAQCAMELGEVWVVAPAQQCSAMSHKISIHNPLLVEKVEFPVPVAAAYQVTGTPADCVKVAIHQIMEYKPDYVFSGINDGYNVGFDIAYSGTLGAAFEAVMNGIPAIAFSAPGGSLLDVAQAHLTAVAKELIERGQGIGEVWNVNFPSANCKGILWERKIAPMQFYSENYMKEQLSQNIVRLTSQGNPMTLDDHAPFGTDIEAVLNGYISIGKVKSAVL